MRTTVRAVTWVVAVAFAVFAPPVLAQPAAKAAAPRVDVRSTHQDIQKTLGMVPTFMKQLPEAALPGAWQAMKGLELNPETKLSGKHKELIGLAVAAQIPCSYCVHFHTAAARLHGATDEEIREAIGMSALTREWSTVINGQQQELSQFRAEMDKMTGSAQSVGGAGQAGQPGAAPPAKPNLAPVPDARAARQDIRTWFGMVPSFIEAVPESMLAGAWNEWKALEFNEQTALPAKVKSLISLAVAAQIPCDYCVYADKQSAVSAGASQEEVNEAIGMAAITRHWSTVLNGSMVDENQFRNETRKMMRHIQKQQQAQGGAGESGTPGP